MDLKCTINCLRRRRVGLDRIYMTLALLELHIDDNPFFVGLKDEELVVTISLAVDFHEQYFNNELLDDYSSQDFIPYLCSQKEFRGINLNDLMKTYKNIKMQGEENYGFKRLNRMDEGSAKEGQS